MSASCSGDQGRLPPSDLYIVYSMSNSPYQRWQADLLDFSVREVGQPGVIVRLCSLETAFPDLVARPSSRGYTFVTPSYAEVGEGPARRFIRWVKRLLKRPAPGRYHFFCLNKPHAVKAFLESHPSIDSDAVLLWLDPDMVFNRPWEPPALMVRPGHVVGQRWWGYDAAWCRANGGSAAESLCPASDEAIMFPFCISAGDMRKITDAYCRFSREIYRRTRDWLSEMYAHAMAMRAAGLECHPIAALGPCNNWADEVTNDASAPISHYTQPMVDVDGRELWDKRKYTPHALSKPWRRPPPPEEAATLTDRRTLEMLHRFIDWQQEESG
ncbi:MAG: hypothetical protein PVH41_12085 [Anaerolineae bacterium]|jgi:hypothetical protein